MPQFRGAGDNIIPDPIMITLPSKSANPAVQPHITREPVQPDLACLAPSATAITEQW